MAADVPQRPYLGRLIRTEAIDTVVARRHDGLGDNTVVKIRMGHAMMIQAMLVQATMVRAMLGQAMLGQNMNGACRRRPRRAP